MTDTIDRFVPTVTIPQTERCKTTGDIGPDYVSDAFIEFVRANSSIQERLASIGMNLDFMNRETAGDRIAKAEAAKKKAQLGSNVIPLVFEAKGAPALEEATDVEKIAS